MITIRNAEPGDYLELASLGRRAFHEAFAHENDPSDMQAYLDLAFNPDTIRNQLMDSNCTFLIAYFDNEPVGYVKLKRNSFPPELEGKPCIQLERIYALQAFVGKKIGKALMEKAVSIASDEKLDYIWLGVWQENKIAITFYKKWGFEVIGVKQFIIGKNVNDDYVMAKKIDHN